MSGKKDYYETLGVDRGADKATIKKAYRKLAMQYHPDRNPDNAEAEAKFKQASEAAEILLDDDKRRRYDQFGHAGVDGQAGGFSGGSGFSGFGDFGDIFGDIFGDFMGGGRSSRSRSRAQAGNDLQMTIQVSFEEAAFGATKTVEITRSALCDVCHGSGAEGGAKPATCDTCGGTGQIRRQQGFFTMASTCPRCNGSGQIVTNPCKSCGGKGLKKKKAELEVKIPAGIDRGQRLKLSGEGDSGVYGGPSGDLYIVVDVKPHDFFVRDGHDIYCEIPISFSQAALGAEIEIPTLSGKVTVNIPEGTQSGKKMRLRGKGIQHLGGYGNGDLILTIHVETPTKLCKEQRELLTNLGKFDKEGSCHPMGKNFFDKVKNLFQ